MFFRSFLCYLGKNCVIKTKKKLARFVRFSAIQVCVCCCFLLLGCRGSDNKAVDPQPVLIGSGASTVVPGTSLSTNAPTNEPLKKIEIDVQVVYSQQAMLWASGELDTYSIAGGEQKADPTNPYRCETLLRLGKVKHDLQKALSAVPHVCETDNSLVDLSVDCLQADPVTLKLCQRRAYIRNLINISIAEINQVYKNSGAAHVQFRLVDVVELSDDFVEKFPAGEVLHEEATFQVAGWFLSHMRHMVKFRNFDKTDVAFKSAHESRLKSRADISVLLLKGKFNFLHSAGIAADVLADSPKNTVAILDINGAAFPRYVFTHEVSHLLGAHHGAHRGEQETYSELVKAQVDPVGSAYFPDGQSFAGEINGKKYATIMSACEDCARMPFLSNPDIKIGPAQLPIGDSLSRLENNVRVVAENAIGISKMDEAWVRAYQAEKAPLSQKIGVDFGFDQLNNVSYKADQNWNAVTNPYSGTMLTLQNELGEVTPIKLEIISGFGGVGLAHFSAQAVIGYGIDEMPVMSMVDGFFATKEQPAPAIVLSGLNPRKSYSLTVFGSADVFNQPLKTKYILTGKSNTEGTLMVAGNMMRFLTFKNLQSTDQGTLQLVLSSSLISATEKVWLNAFELTEH